MARQANIYAFAVCKKGDLRVQIDLKIDGASMRIEGRGHVDVLFSVNMVTGSSSALEQNFLSF